MITTEQARFRRRLVAACVVLVVALIASIAWWVTPNRRAASISAVSVGATKSELVVEIADFLRDTKVDVVELAGEVQVRVSGERRDDDAQSVARVRLRRPIAGRDVVDLNGDIRFVLVGDEYVRAGCPASRLRCEADAAAVDCKHVDPDGIVRRSLGATYPVERAECRGEGLVVEIAPCGGAKGEADFRCVDEESTQVLRWHAEGGGWTLEELVSTW